MATRDEIIARYEDKVRRISERRDLNPQARNVALARALRTARDGLQALADEQVTAATKRRQALERAMFGSVDHVTGPAALSRRDAADRAARIEDPAEALALLQRSTRAGDEDLCQAIAAHAADLAREPKWAAVVNTYAESRPKAAEALAELQQLPDYRNPVTKLRHAAEHFVTPPTEIGALAPHQVDALAASDILPDDAA